MCGIVAYIGHKPALPLLLEGLKRLEYRGYDSAGVAVADKGRIKVAKSVGRVRVLEDKIEKAGDERAFPKPYPDGAEPVLRAAVPATGGWDRYKHLKLGTVKLPAGAGRLTVRPDGPIRGALLDLRTVYLVPVGATPQEPKADAPKTPAEAAKVILSESTPKDRREALAKQSAGRAAEVVRAMTADLPDDTKEEYRRIPWIWRVSIAAGRTNDAKALADLLDASLPKPGEHAPPFLNGFNPPGWKKKKRS